MVRISLFIFICIIGIRCTSSTDNKVISGNPTKPISNDSLLNLLQYHTFLYFWDGAEPISGAARERYHADGSFPESENTIVTIGGTGFGLMALIVGIEREFISREEGINRFNKILTFLEKSDRFHGVWPHWLDGKTGTTKPFSQKDDGADLVETSFLAQGLITARQYFQNGSIPEKHLADRFDRLWRDINWAWHTRGENVLYWHWSPKYEWEMNFKIQGYNECLITYVLAASSPTYPITPKVYHEGWAKNGAIKNNISHSQYGYHLSLQHNGNSQYGGPLFWSHYSFLGLNPNNLVDQYANYWEHNVNHTLINYSWCVENPKKYKGYGKSNWGLTSSYSPNGYAGHAPGENDLGVISPTAAISSIPYTPEKSMQVIRDLYKHLGDKVWGKYGFYDAYSEEKNWFPKQYLAIDQGPMIIMIENYRSGLLWDLFMSAEEVKKGLDALEFYTDG